MWWVYLVLVVVFLSLMLLSLYPFSFHSICRDLIKECDMHVMLQGQSRSKLSNPTGYIGRALLHKNPWDKNAFQMQICTIILAPTFVCVSIYLTLKHVTLALRPELSRFAPRWYPIIFLPADLSCLVVQAIGGGIAAAAGNKDKKLLDGGNNAIIAGVALQVVVLLWFGAMAADYYVRVRKYMRSPEADHDGGVSRALSVWRDPKFRRFAFAVTGAYACILIRCIYR